MGAKLIFFLSPTPHRHVMVSPILHHLSQLCTDLTLHHSILYHHIIDLRQLHTDSGILYHSIQLHDSDLRILRHSIPYPRTTDPRHLHTDFRILHYSIQLHTDIRILHHSIQLQTDIRILHHSIPYLYTTDPRHLCTWYVDLKPYTILLTG